MRHSVYDQFKDRYKLVGVLQMDIDHLNLNFVHAIVMWLFQPQGLAHHSDLIVCHKVVSGVVISTTKAWLTILASLCAISL